MDQMKNLDYNQTKIFINLEIKIFINLEIIGEENFYLYIYIYIMLGSKSLEQLANRGHKLV